MRVRRRRRADDDRARPLPGPADAARAAALLPRLADRHTRAHAPSLQVRLLTAAPSTPAADLAPPCAHDAGRAAAVHCISEPTVADAPPAEWPDATAPVVDSLNQWAGRDWPGKSRSLDAMRGGSPRKRCPAPVCPRAAAPSAAGGTCSSTPPASSAPSTTASAGGWSTRTAARSTASAWTACRPSIDVPRRTAIEDLFDGAAARSRTTPDVSLVAVGAHGAGRFSTRWRTTCARALGERLVREVDAHSAARRLRRWGFNTVGNWSDRAFCRGAEMPYVWPLADSRRPRRRDLPRLPGRVQRRVSPQRPRASPRSLEGFRGDRA